MKKTTFIFLIISTLVLRVQAVDDNPPAYGSITGSVVDGLSKEPLPYVNVVVRNSNDSLLTGGITDEEGNFSIKAIPEGSNKVEIQFIGYEKITREVDVSRSQAKHNLSTISLSESSQQLDEVVVRGELSSVTQKIDRKVINVGKDLTSTGTTASELLNNVQSVSVDQQSGAISLRGNENVKILVDGVPVIGRLDGNIDLSQLNLVNVDHIEIVEGPMSVIYGSNALAGVVNIITRENKYSQFRTGVHGYYESVGIYNLNGNVDTRFGNHALSFVGGRNFFGGYSLVDSSRSQEWKPKEQYNAGASYSFRKEKTSLKYKFEYFRENLLDRSDLFPP
ncbi:MAG: carboxypeptidase-like regulatory domain-containing protein, partial [Bacteroidales bacterium]|nr:carboxypeptidase-like regulatory domain-containing protein [Bacteroidales bacterium]